MIPTATLKKDDINIAIFQIGKSSIIYEWGDSINSVIKLSFVRSSATTMTMSFLKEGYVKYADVRPNFDEKRIVEEATKAFSSIHPSDNDKYLSKL